jgi:hypothetical protein
MSTYSMYDHIPNVYTITYGSSMIIYCTYMLFVESDKSYIMRHICGSSYKCM